ncbi:MAG: glycosyltransferase family 4 protein [Gemmataceae bacterium]
MTAPAVALYYDPDGYVERTAPGPAGAARGLMGRQVAGRAFLDAYLAHGTWDTLTAVVRDRRRAAPLVAAGRAHPAARGRRLRVLTEREFPPAADPPAVLHFPNPPDPRFAWARHATGTGAALCGVTHTLATPAAAAALCDLVAAPFEPCDALVCTSRAVAAMVRAVTDSYRAYLADRCGAAPPLRPRLEVVPLGVDPAAFRPPDAAARAAARARFGVADDEVVVLCVGRLSHHAKAHPYPLFHAASEAARRTGARVRLLMAGWAANPAVAAAFEGGARVFAPAARVTFADGQHPAVRAAAWPAADVFASLPDNVQETFGLVVVEAMASGLPVVAADWDGYRDLVSDGETGLLVPTRLVAGATTGATGRLLGGLTNYDHFLAECSQAAAVDAAAAADALTRLVADAAMRARLGAAGRARAVERFAWKHVVAAYEALWADQAREFAARPPRAHGPVRYPPPEVSFAGYPTAWLTDDDALAAAPDAAPRLAALLAMPLTNLAAASRCADPAALAALLAAAPASVGDLARTLEARGVPAEAARATVAWLLKYGLLAPAG